jgi:hypothetical protein
MVASGLTEMYMYFYYNKNVDLQDCMDIYYITSHENGW